MWVYAGKHAPMSVSVCKSLRVYDCVCVCLSVCMHVSMYMCIRVHLCASVHCVSVCILENNQKWMAYFRLCMSVFDHKHVETN